MLLWVVAAAVLVTKVLVFILSPSLEEIMRQTSGEGV